MVRQRNLLFTYLLVSVSTATTLGGYVACGAQNYRVAIHGEMPMMREKAASSDPSRSTGNSSELPLELSQESIDDASSSWYAHSSRGWGGDTVIAVQAGADLSPHMVKAIQNAMRTWEKAVGKKLFAFQGVDSKSGADFPTIYDSLNDDVTGQYLDYHWSSKSGRPKSVLATTVWENAFGDKQRIVRADIHFNAEGYVFGDALVDRSEGTKIIVDAESLALHEVGHLLGLSHMSEEDDRFSIMNPALFVGEGMTSRRLSKGDIQRIREIYGTGEASLASTLEVADYYFDFGQL